MDEQTVNKWLATLPPEAFSYQGKFAAKLDKAQRCEVLAFHIRGVSRGILAKATGLDKRTISHIYNPQSKHYKDIREERLRLGDKEFMREYITEEMMIRIAELTQGSTEKGPSKSAGGVAGIHLIESIMGGKHRVIIEWQDKHEEGPGWYYKDLDSDWPDQWFHNDAESRMTSNACLKAVKENL